MEANWFYEIEGQQRGPLGEAELRELRSNGSLSERSLIWKDGMSDWKPFGEIFPEPNIAPQTTGEPAPANGAPPLPPRPPSVPGGLMVQTPFVPRQAKLRDDSAPRIWSSLGRGWKLMCADFGPHLGYFALTSLIAGVAIQFLVPMFFLMLPIMGGCYWAFLKKSRGEGAELGDIFEGFKRRFGDLALVNLATLLPGLVFMGLVLGLMVGGCAVVVEQSGSQVEEIAVPILIFFGVFLALAGLGYFTVLGTLASMLCLDCEITAGQALKLTFAGCMRHFFRILFFGLVITILSYSGLIVLYIGAIFTSLWTTMATVYIYKDLFEEEPSAP